MGIKEEKIGLSGQVDLVIVLGDAIKQEGELLKSLNAHSMYDLARPVMERIRRYERLRGVISECTDMYVVTPVPDGQANDLH